MKKNILVLTLITIASGFFFSSVYNFQALGNPMLNPQRNSSLVGMIENIETEIAEDRKRVEELRAELENYEQMVSAEERSIRELRNEIYLQRLAAGLVPLEGTGIKVIIDDNKEGLQENPEDNPNYYIVHYDSLLSIVEELKRAGAEAISINEQRIVTTSDIRCVGNVILVNTTRIAPPFNIAAIGNPQLLERFLINSNEYLFLHSSEFPVSYELYQEPELLNIPSYKGSVNFTYTQVIN